MIDLSVLSPFSFWAFSFSSSLLKELSTIGAGLCRGFTISSIIHLSLVLFILRVFCVMFLRCSIRVLGTVRLGLPFVHYQDPEINIIP